MRSRRLGNSDIVTSEVGFGCARIGGVFQGSTRRELLDLLRAAFDNGITFFDTADMYTQGESERLVGEAFQKQRDRVVIASKFGYRLPAQKRLVTRIKPLVKPIVARLGLRPGQVHASLRGAVAEQDFSAAYISAAVEASLRRLRTDFIDIYQLHDPPREVLERGEFVEPLERLRAQGKIRAWGVACQQPEDVLACLGHTSLGSVQVGLSVLEQAALDAAIPRAAANGVGVIARQVFASGLLTRPAERISSSDLDRDQAVAERKRARLATFASVAERSGRTPAELAMQFSLSRAGISVVLLGISRADQLAPCLAGLRAPALTRDEEDLLVVRAA